MEKRENRYNEEDILIATQVQGARLHYELDYRGYHYDIFYEHGYVYDGLQCQDTKEGCVAKMRKKKIERERPSSPFLGHRSKESGD